MDILSEIDSTGLAAAKALDLAVAYSSRTRACFRNYADILYARILDDVHPRRHKILQDLEVAVADAGACMSVKIWDYSITYPTNGEKLSVFDAMDASARGHHTVVFDNGKPLSVDAIFRNTDLDWRLAYTFGSKFRVRLTREDTKMISEKYTSYRIGVYLVYSPYGLAEYEEQKLIAAYKDVCDRQLHAGKNVSMTARY